MGGPTMNVGPPGHSLALVFRPAQGAPAEEKLSITFPLRNPISVPFQEKVFTAFEMFEPSAVIPFPESKETGRSYRARQPRCLSAGP
jgi:hypothetical protein